MVRTKRNAARRGPDGASEDVSTWQVGPFEDTVHALRFQRDVEAVHRLGPRAVAELLLELKNGADLDDRLARYAELDPATVRALGADRFPPHPLSVVRAA